MPQTLNPLTFPLHGARLIEASAGTGKTFTISGLYLRLLLGHGDAQSRRAEPLSVDQILVVTFTEAATAELRDRIRTKIHQARIALLRNQAQDPFIHDLLTEISDKKWAAQQLLNAERQMDEAAIYTIHGFCQRMLAQNAFESGSRFRHELIKDESKLKAQVVADYWRRHFYSLSLDLAKEVRAIWSSPKQLLNDISGLISGSPVTLSVKAMEQSLEQLHQDNIARIDALKKSWLEAEEEIVEAIKSSDVSKRSFTSKNLPAWIADVSDWANCVTASYQLPDKLEKFSVEFLNEKTPQGKVVPQHPLFDDISQLVANPPQIKAPLLAHAIEKCREKLRQLKQQKYWLSFDDLLSNLSAAIDTDEHHALVERIRQLYPVAMIDEFQDTDPLQYSIFKRIYLPHPQAGLFMIGDPKQAIYGFRGADIFTYIRARNEVQDHYTLGTNWRSSAAMVKASNGLFEQSDSPFLYDKDIPFYAVGASPNAEKRSWWLQGKRQKACSIWLQNADSPLSKSDYMAQMAQQTAAKIAQILQTQDNNKTYFVDNKGDKKPIKAGDIAVLVRSGSEGQLIREALAKQSIASVYLSNRDTVFKSSMAVAILRLLMAALYPDNERLLRAALACDVLIKSSKELDELNENEARLEATINTFRSFRLIWQQRGVMPMLRAVMSAENIAENLLAQPFGERLLTDFLHLTELLQQASLEQDSDHALVRWFSETISQVQSGAANSGSVTNSGNVTNSGSAASADEQIQRLESERNLVQVVTIHKSKGLEYDLVFLPFVSAYRESQSGQYYDATQQTTILDISKKSQSIAKSDQERLAEDLRLLYVAVTRAVYGCFIGIAPLRRGRFGKDPSGAHLSAVGYLVQQGKSASASELQNYTSQFISGYADVMEWIPVPEPVDLNQQMDLFEPDLFEHNDHGEHKAPHDLSARKVQSKIETNWYITSYSALIRQGHGQSPQTMDINVQSAGLDIDSAFDKSDTVNLTDETETTIFTFPRGARPGTFLHTLFENIDFTLASDSDETTAVILQLLQSEQYDTKWLPILQQLIHRVLSTPLDGKALRLCEKEAGHKLVEMEFLLPIASLSSSLLNKLNKKFDTLSRLADKLNFREVKGMLKGFIDLVFIHQGKYYVLDWKSNYLGDKTSDYGEEALQQVMLEHRYDLQYQIYALALHRFLQTRIPDYSYEHHFGGVYYLFLRGVDGQGNGVFFNRPEADFLEGFSQLIGDDK